MGRLGCGIILLNCCKWLQINRTFFQGITMPVRHSDRRNGFSCCLYRTFVTWKLVLGSNKLAEGLPTRWRPLYDRYGPVRPGPPPPLRCALARTPNNPCYREATTPTRQSGCKTGCERGYAAKTLRCQFKEECVRHPQRRTSALSFPLRPVVSGLGVLQSLFSFQRFCFPLLVLWSVVTWSRCPIVPLSHFSFSAWPSGL
jgi:hypothetical protein